MNLSYKLKECREALGLTQQDLADMVGVSKRTIAAYETDGALPRAHTYIKLASALKVSEEYLKNDEIDDPNYDLSNSKYEEKTYDSSIEYEINELLARSSALFAGGELSEEAKDDFFTAVTKAYLQCKEEARKRSKNDHKLDKE